MTDFKRVNKLGPKNFPIGSKVMIKGYCYATKKTNEEGTVTAHGYSIYGNGRLVGVKVPGEIGSALVYNREVFACSLQLIK